MGTGSETAEESLFELIDAPDYESLYRSEHGRLVRVAALIVGRQYEAEEIVHDVFVKLVKDNLRPENPPAYLRRMVVNACYSRHRRRRLEAKHIEAKRGERRPGLAELPEIDETFTLLADPPDRQRIAIVLRFYDDMLIDDIATAMGAPPGTVKSLLHRGLKTLKTKLEDGGR